MSYQCFILPARRVPQAYITNSFEFGAFLCFGRTDYRFNCIHILNPSVHNVRFQFTKRILCAVFSLTSHMTKISRSEFERICEGIAADRDPIIRHNPIGTDKEVLLWMLLNCLHSYLSLTEQEVPCFKNVPDEETYRNAILLVLRERTEGDFDPEPIIDNLIA